MIIDEDIYLEHHGVKGMKWGVRKDNAVVGKRKKPLTQKERRRRRERNIKYANRAVLAAFASLYVATIVLDEMNRGPRPQPHTPPKRPQTPEDVINATRDMKVNAIIRTHKEGHIDEEQMKKFVADVNRRYDKKVQEAKTK